MKRLKKILKWTAISLGGLVAIGLIANAWFVWTTDRRLERQLAAIRAAGEPLTLADLARKPIPPEQNAATYLRRAKAGVYAIYKEIWEHFKGGPEHAEWERFEAENPMSAQTQKAVKAIFSAHPDVIPLLQQAAACPDYDAQLDFTLSPKQALDKWMPVIQDNHAYRLVIVWRARLLMAEGNYDEAIRTVLILFRLAKHYSRTPTLLGYLPAATVRGVAVRAANLVLQSGPVSKEVREALDAELVVQEPLDEFKRMLESERAFGIDCFRHLPFRNVWLLNRGKLNQWESEYLDVIQAFLTLSDARDFYHKANQVIHRITEQISATWPDEISAESLFLALGGGLNAVTWTSAEIRSLRVLNALQTHVPRGSGKVPKLSELGLPAETTIDPFNGEPLHVKRLPNGWLVYSVGRNLQDDGGALEHHSDIGVGPPPPAALRSQQ